MFIVLSLYALNIALHILRNRMIKNHMNILNHSVILGFKHNSKI